MSSRLAFAPERVNSRLATSKIRSRFRCASARRFLSVLEGEHYGTALLLYLTTGMRRGEVLALRWSDVDLAGGCLHVRQALTGRGRDDRPVGPGPDGTAGPANDSVDR